MVGRAITTALLCLYFCACETKHSDLVFKRSSINAENLRIDGYYYVEDLTLHETRRSIYFLYANGVILDCGSGRADQFDQHLLDSKFTKNLKEDRTRWGIVQINGDSIAFEKWYHGGGPPKIPMIRSGIVLNDSTFLITKLIDSHSREEAEIYEFYHFRKFAPKPDSVNPFIP